MKWLWWLTPFKRTMILHINYKSGIQEEFPVYYFWRKTEDDEFKSLKWVTASNKKPIVMNLNHIESIWLGKVTGIFTLPESLDPK